MRLNRGLFVLLLFASLTSARAEKGFAPSAGDVRPLMVGDATPDVTLVDAAGIAFGLAATEGKKPVVAVFYRGHW